MGWLKRSLPRKNSKLPLRSGICKTFRPSRSSKSGGKRKVLGCKKPRHAILRLRQRDPRSDIMVVEVDQEGEVVRVKALALSSSSSSSSSSSPRLRVCKYYGLD